jgi:hypothetical protein
VDDIMTKKRPNELCQACRLFDYEVNHKDGVCFDYLVVCNHDAPSNLDPWGNPMKDITEKEFRADMDSLMGIKPYKEGQESPVWDG